MSKTENIICAACGHTMNRNGKRDGRQVWRCRTESGGCGASFTEDALPPHRPRQGAEPLSDSERQKRRYKKKKKQQQKE